MSRSAAASGSSIGHIFHLPVTSNRSAFAQAASASQRILVELSSAPPSSKGRLSTFVQQGVERELQRRGAATGARQSSAPRIQHYLEDALYRARLLGAGGLAVSFGGLRGLADENDTLSPADSRTLRELLDLAGDHPLQLLFPEGAEGLRVHPEPMPLVHWLPDADAAGHAVIEYESESETHAEGEVGGALGAPEDETEGALEAGAIGSMPTLSPPALGAFLQREDPREQPARRVATPAETFGDPCETEPYTQPEPRSAAAAEPGFSATAEPAFSATLEPEPSPRPSTVVLKHPPPEPDDERQVAEDCQGWARELQRMSGPKVHSAVEKAFATAYVPLTSHAAAHRAPEQAVQALCAWGEDFAQGYSAAFEEMQHHRRRPKMVKDVTSFATRWAEFHRVTHCELLVVSGLRFDLGQLLNRKLAQQLGKKASCTDHALLWSALPSNSYSQDLGASRRAEAACAPALRGTAFCATRLQRLDSLEPELRQTGEPEPERLQRLAGELADEIAPWIEQKVTDTLIVLFGDHGFSWPRQGVGTPVASIGGALPEQVLVPATAWITGAAPRRISPPLGETAR